MTDRVTDAYVRRCLNGDRGLLDAMREARARFSPALAAAYGDAVLPRPLFMDESRIRGCADDLVGLFHLLVSLPDRLYDGDLGRYCADLGIPPRRAALIKRFSGPPDLYGRADLYHDGTGFKLLEFNIDSALGGTDRAEITRSLLEVAAFRTFADEHDLGHVHTGERVALALREAARPVTGGADPVIGFIESDGGLPTYMRMVRSFKEMMERFGLEVVLGEIGQVRSRGGRLYVGDRPIDVVLRYFNDQEVVDGPGGEEAVEPIFRAHEEGTAVLWTTMRSWQVFNKGCLAMLSEPRARRTFTPRERDLVDRILPWTRALTGRRTDVDGTEVDLFEHCRENRTDLILKPYGGFGGKGIVAGWEVTDAEWVDALMTGLNRHHVVQRRVTPRNEPVVDPGTGAPEDWNAVWDVFVTPQGYAGGRVRALPSGDRAVINEGAQQAALTNGIFTYPTQGTTATGIG